MNYWALIASNGHMRFAASVWCSLGVLTVVLVGGIAHSKQQSHKLDGVVLPSLRTSPPTQAVVEGSEARLIRLEMDSNASVPEMGNVAASNPAEKAPALAGAIETQVRIRGNLPVSDSQAIDLAVSNIDDRANWIVAVEKWVCGKSTGLALYFPKWSVDRQLMSPIVESAGLGIGLQYRLTF